MRHYLVGSLGGGSRVNPLVVAVVTDTHGGSADTAVLAGANTDNLVMDGARDAVVDLNVQLGQNVLLVDRGIRNVTDGGRLDHVADGEALDSLVLGDHTAAVGAANRGDVATALLVASVGSSLLRHCWLGISPGGLEGRV